jgi:hypothetical protein
MPVRDRYRPSQTVLSGTQGARPADDHDRRITVKATLTPGLLLLLYSCKIHPMPSETLVEELRKLRKRYHHSTFSLEAFVRDSLEGISGKRGQLLRALGEIGGVASKNENVYPDSEDSGYSEFKDAVSEFGAGKLKTIIEMALAESLQIGEPHTRMLLEMSVTYACALFDGLVSDVLITVFRHVPEALRSGRTLTAEEVLGFSSREDLIEELARREALELAYKSADGQFSHFRKAFNIDVFGLQSLDVTIADLAAIRERRNLIVP